MNKIIVFFLLFLGSIAFAQESTNFKLYEYVFNEGGHPDDGIVLTSSSYNVTLDAIGDCISSEKRLSSPSYRMDAGFVPSYPPPTEVVNLIFDTDHQTLKWNKVNSKKSYNLYRDLLSNLSGYGTCKEYGILEEQTTDSEEPSTGEGYFYLVTVKNMLDEEGTKGFDSSSNERPNPNPCP